MSVEFDKPNKPLAFAQCLVAGIRLKHFPERGAMKPDDARDLLAILREIDDMLVRLVRVDWIPVDKTMPDDDETVLIALDDGEVWTGYHDGDEGWKYVSGDTMSAKVTHWMQLPDPPK